MAQQQQGQDGSYSRNLESEPYQAADILLSNYMLGKTLGVGSFGKVRVAEHILTGHKVAIKILNRKKIQSMDMEEKVRREIKIFSLFMHPHIIRLYEVIKTPTDIFVVMEYVKSGELFDYIVEKGRLAEEEARHFFQQIISGLEYCHRNMVVHRDLKPENLLLDARHNIKIADFGLSNVMRDGHFLKTSCGSPNYAAPEVISGKLYAGPEVDVWSCGIILYALLCGSLPFDDESIPNLFKKIKNGIYTLPTHLSPGARDIIPRMLLVDPLKRITIPEIRQHPWFTYSLPRYLAVMQVEPNSLNARIDEETLKSVVKMGFDRDQLVSALQKRKQTKGTVAYYLQLDNQALHSQNNYLQMELTEASQARLQHPSGMMTAGRDARSGRQMIQTQRLVAEKHWRLGVRMRKPPYMIMHDVDLCLKAMKITWKKLGPYNYKCHALVTANLSRRRLGISDNMEDEMTVGMTDEETPTPVTKVVKFEIQVYRVRMQEYLVDMQRLSGDLFLFVDICADLLSRLGSNA